MPVVSDFTALLRINDLYASRWNGFTDLAVPVIVTYSFADGDNVPTVAESLRPASSTSAFTETQRENFRDVTDIFSAVAGVIFVEVEEGGMIDISNVDGSAWGGWANYAYSSGVYTSSGVLVLDNSGSYAPGSYAFQTMLHELGHATGLQHPHSGSVTLDPSLDNQNNTVMTYNNTYPYTASLGSFDIQALEYLYGSSVDTSDWSLVYDEANQILNVVGDDGDNTIVGALGQNHLDGGAGDDIIFGREDDDVLIGGAGADTLWGRQGDDTLFGGSGDDTMLLLSAMDQYSFTFEALANVTIFITNLVTGEIDIIDSIENFEFADISMSFNDLFAYTDLGFTSVSGFGSPDLTQGLTVDADIYVQNYRGTTDAIDVTVHAYLSTDGTLDGADVLVGSHSFASIAAGGFAHTNIALTAPVTLADGEYTLIYSVDPLDTFIEWDETNNIAVVADTVTVGASETVITDTGNNAMTGSAGVDIFTLAADGIKNEVRGFDDGNDRIDLSRWTQVSGIGDLILHQNGNHVMVIGGDQRVELRSINVGLLSAEDFIFAGADNVIIDTGDNAMTGTAEIDVFTLAADGIMNAVHGFDDGRDLIDLSAWAQASGLGDLTLTQNGSHVRVLAGEQSVEIRNIDASLLSAADFIFSDTGNVIPDTGNNAMIGTSGADVFALAADGIKNEVRGFDDGNDHIDLSAWAQVSGIDDLILHQNGNHVMVIGGDQRVELRSINASLLSAADFIFAGEDVSGNVIFDTGNNALIGTSEADIFTLDADGIKNEVRGFDDDRDRIDVSAWTQVRGIDDLILHQNGNHVMVIGGDQRVEIRSINASLLSAEDFIFGANGDTPDDDTENLIEGTSGDDRNGNKLVGTSGVDRIIDNAGRDEMQGGDGADVFEFVADGEKDDILDFAVGVDSIDIRAWNAGAFTNLSITANGASAMVRFEAETLEIKHVAVSELHADDFIFA